MEKTKQKNWLLILTTVLLISSVILIYFSVEDKIRIGTCVYDGVSYSKGDIISGYESGSNCICGDRGNIECTENESLDNTPISDFSSSNLDFTYRLLNLLEKSVPDTTSIEISDATYTDSVLTLTLEKEAYCSEDDAPVTVGFYKYSQDVLKLTVLTNRDSVYTLPCSVENTYEISKLEISDSLEIYYQTEEGKLYHLDTCIDDGRIFTEGDVFQSSEDNSVCTCGDGVVDCN